MAFNSYADVAAALKAESDVWSKGQGHTNDAIRQNALAARAWWNSQQSSSSAPTSTPAPPPPPPAPPLPKFTRMTAPDKNIKVASSDIIQFDDNAVDIALIQDLLFENIGATELANISRTDLIDGQEVIYSPIKNLPSVRREFNPNNIVATSYSTDYFSRFGIDIIQRGVNEPYIDDNGNLVVEVDSVGEAEEIQVQILSNGTIDLIEEI
jgi:hypothetical protein